MNKPTAVYIWSDGLAVYIGQSAYPRERRGQHRSSARKGSRTAFHAYLRAHAHLGVDSGGTWHTQWVDSTDDALRLEGQLIEQAMQSGRLLVLNVDGGPAVAALASELNWRAGLEACRRETAYLDRHVGAALGPA
jgi:hypothetical protein